MAYIRTLPAARRRPREAESAFLPVMHQDWRDLLFLHWQVDPQTLAGRIPDPLHLDVHHGAAWIGLVPFEVQRLRLPLLPPLPFVASFGEVNVRTYVRWPDGERGVWFFSLDAASTLAVLGARLGYRLPYFAAEIRLRRLADERAFEAARVGAPGRCRASWRRLPGELTRAAPGSLEEFLIERYVLFAADGEKIFRARVRHEPYPLAPVELVTLDQDLVQCAGFEVAPRPVQVHYSPGVDVAVSAPVRRIP